MKTLFTIAAFIVWSGMIFLPFYRGMKIIIDTLKDFVRNYRQCIKDYQLKFVIDELGWILLGLFLVAIAVMVALIPFVY